ncbi:MAG TPA: 50S ribosomal protein L17 [Firmicutes bacterium]|jgi:large subunit ribosomal protein L17|nr:50S ribosomal protein L17 [Bacillota bacterium]HAW70354.1 50S ribosomal protein L17 [Bacillota bacterium]HAZ21091.1 50S ribosomal protein L17 [Bacillota bacterium]HBE05474.1 50S ribosomal protein L17 [Bacillota bacterium]HBG45138.1 50S ribosomal protein L17 [Bacillota bacterium]
MQLRRLGRNAGHRRSLFRNSVTALFENEKIQTTEIKAKEISVIAEKMVTLAKKGDLGARRQAAAFINDSDVVKKLFETIGPRYAERAGGYTRILKVGPRRGDAAPMAIIELV